MQKENEPILENHWKLYIFVNFTPGLHPEECFELYHTQFDFASNYDGDGDGDGDGDDDDGDGDGDGEDGDGDGDVDGDGDGDGDGDDDDDDDDDHHLWRTEFVKNYNFL